MNQVFSILAGIFITNGIPHFVNGISGKQFHSPFAKPPGKGKSSPLSNVIWGLINFLIGFILINFIDQLKIGINLNFILFMLGVIFVSINLSRFFNHGE